jgi:RNA recognition motif-containing protein
MAEAEYRCFVGGLAWATDSEALEKAFSHFGEIVESKVRLLLRSDLTPIGFGFSLSHLFCSVVTL